MKKGGDEQMGFRDKVRTIVMEQRAKLAHQKELREVQRSVARETAGTEAHRIAAERGRAKGMEQAKWMTAGPMERTQMMIQKARAANAKFQTVRRQVAPQPPRAQANYYGPHDRHVAPPAPRGGIPVPSLLDHSTFGLRQDVEQRGPILRKEWFR
jgi:hypothetical protein